MTDKQVADDRNQVTGARNQVIFIRKQMTDEHITDSPSSEAWR